LLLGDTAESLAAKLSQDAARRLNDDFGDVPEFVLLQHRDEQDARSRYPGFAPMSTSILALHRLTATSGGVPALILERHGSLPVDAIRQVLQPLDLDVVLGPRARVRLPQREEALASPLS